MWWALSTYAGRLNHKICILCFYKVKNVSEKMMDFYHYVSGDVCRNKIANPTPNGLYTQFVQAQHEMALLPPFLLA